MVCIIRFFRHGTSNLYTGMTCQSCVKSVTSALSSLEGVKNVSVSLPNSSATINYDPTTINEDQLIEAIEDCGFDTSLTEQDSSPLLKIPPNDLVQLTTLPPMSITDAKSKEKSGVTNIAKTTLSVKGMTCASCVANIEKMVSPSTLPGLLSISVNLMSEQAVAEHELSILSADQIAEAIDDVGFEASVISTTEVNIWKYSCGFNNQYGNTQNIRNDVRFVCIVRRIGASYTP